MGIEMIILLAAAFSTATARVFGLGYSYGTSEVQMTLVRSVTNRRTQHLGYSRVLDISNERYQQGIANC